MKHVSWGLPDTGSCFPKTMTDRRKGGRLARLRPWLLAASSGLVLAVALPGLCWVPFLLVFPGLLLEALRGVTGWRRAAALGWLAGISHWALATNWALPVMDKYGGLPTPVAVLCLILMAIYLGFNWAVVAWLTCLVPDRLRVWLFPAVWIAVETWRQFLPYRFPWNSTVAGLAHLPTLLGTLPVWGSSGLGWALVAVGSGLWGLTRRDNRRRALFAIPTALLLVVAASLLAPAPAPAGRSLKVAALQPGTTLEEIWDHTRTPELAARVWQLTREAAGAGAELVLWPESAVGYNLDFDARYQAAVVDLARELDLVIVLNSTGKAAAGGYTNSAYLVDSEGVSPVRYDKIRLVPYGEYVPLLARFAFADSLTREVGRFTAGSSLAPLSAQVPLGVAICYEVVFADLVAGEVRAGAQLLSTLTNDAWYGFSWAPHQHFSQAVLRAVETRRWLIRAALNGISGIVDPTGRVVRRLDLGQSGYLLAAVQPATLLTPRARWGDWWGWLCALVSLGLIVTSRFRPGVEHG